MVIEQSTILQWADEQMLYDVVHVSTKHDNYKILSWSVNQLSGGFGNPVSVGLYRYSGIGQVAEDQFNWSVILKIIQSPANVGSENMGEGEDQTHWNYWKREWFAYQSDIFSNLPDGLCVPRCYKTYEIPGNIVFLWLEDIDDSNNGNWTLDHFASTARQLGKLNATHYSGDTLKSYPWLSIERNRQWIEMMPNWRDVLWDHPIMLNHYPPPEENPFQQMLMESDHFLSKLNLLPKVICHGDTYPTNFMARKGKNGKMQTVALDWALMGIQPVGDDLGQFVYGAIERLKGLDENLIQETLFDAYLSGLQENGLQIDPTLVRLGFTASAALRVGLFQIYLLSQEIEQTTIESVKKLGAESPQESFEVKMARIAYQLIL